MARPYMLGYLFHKLRIHKNLTKGAFAEKCSVPVSYVEGVESGRRVPTLRYCIFCAGEFEMNPEWVKGMWIRERVRWFEGLLRKRCYGEE